MRTARKNTVVWVQGPEPPLVEVADKISYVSMMSVFETTGNWRQALQLLQDVRQEGVEASTSWGAVQTMWRARRSR